MSTRAKPLTREAIAATVRAIPERRDVPAPQVSHEDHYTEIAWTVRGVGAVVVTVSRVNVILSLREPGRPTMSRALGRDAIGAVRSAIDWLYGVKGGAL
jgi:hypothetical protein